MKIKVLTLLALTSTVYFSSCSSAKNGQLNKIKPFTEKDRHIQKSYLELLDLTLNNLRTKDSFRDSIKTLRNPNKVQIRKHLVNRAYVSEEITLTAYDQAMQLYWQIVEFIDVTNNGECFLPFGGIPYNLRGCLGDQVDAIESEANLVKDDVPYCWRLNKALLTRGWELSLIGHDGEDPSYILYPIKNKERVFELVRGLDLKIISEKEWMEEWG